jgi:hypothetical protein
VKPDFPTGEREIAKKCSVGKRLPRESEELLTLRAALLKVLVRAAVPSRATCVIHYNFDLIILLFSIFHHLTYLFKYTAIPT